MLLAMAAADKANGISAENPYQYGPEPGHKQSSPAASSAASKSSSSAEDGDAPSGKDEDEKVTQKKENENKNENKNRNGRYEMKKRPKDATVKHVQQYAFAVPLDE